LVKWPWHEADSSPPSSAEVKNGGFIPPLRHTSSWLSAKLNAVTTLPFLAYFLSFERMKVLACFPYFEKMKVLGCFCDFEKMYVCVSVYLPPSTFEFLNQSL
jgi:hypothetical protein